MTAIPFEGIPSLHPVSQATETKHATVAVAPTEISRARAWPSQPVLRLYRTRRSPLFRHQNLSVVKVLCLLVGPTGTA